MSISFDLPSGKHIFLNTAEKKDNILTGSTSYEKYIICMNDQLTAENHSLHKKLQDLTTEKDSIEDENEKYDISKRYTKGLLHNLVELEKLHNNARIITKDMFNISHSSITYKFIIDLLFLLYTIILFYLDYSILFIITIQIIICTSYTTLQNKHKNNIFYSQLADLDSKITKIKNSQDFIGTYIDNI